MRDASFRDHILTNIAGSWSTSFVRAAPRGRRARPDRPADRRPMLHRRCRSTI